MPADGAFVCRVASAADLPGLRLIMDLAIEQLQRNYLDPAQVAASRSIMGLDTKLVDDGTYFVVEDHGQIIGCGGWSRRATLYGGDHSSDLRDERLLDPAAEPARVRAMYTHPDHARRGVGRLILHSCESAATANGFRAVELVSTLAGEPLYAACGYRQVERIMSNSIDGVAVPLIRMDKALG